MSHKKFLYYKIYKPYGVLSQFTDKAGRKTLKDIFKFPPGVYPVGRLDFDSEGLLLLTDDKRFTDFLLNPVNMHEREYYTQVEGAPGQADLDKFTNGILIRGRSTLPAKAVIIDEPPLPKRTPPIRTRKTIPATWVSLTLIEGKNRQVRHMTAAIGFPTLRLVRVRIKNVLLAGLQPGEVKELEPAEILGLKT